MKKNLWLAFALTAVFGVAAQETATVTRNRVNVRAQPSTNSEVITQVNEGDKVIVFEEIAVEDPKSGEPAVWAKIQIPSNTPVWVFSGALEEHTVKVSRLNLRAGPGENYSILGRLEKGAKVVEIRAIEDWMEIEPPESARVYVDAGYLSGLKRPEIAKPTLNPTPAEVIKDPVVAFEPKSTTATPPVAETATPVPEPKAEPTHVAKAETKPEPEPKKEEPKQEEPKKEEPIVEKTEVKDEPTVAAAKPEEKKPEPTVPQITEAPKPAAATATTEPVDRPAEITRVLPEVGKPLPSAVAAGGSTKRIIRREGEVRSTKFNIQAPTYFELVGENGKIINYLTAEKSEFKLKDYKGLRVVVTGEESIDKRYPERPLLEVETIEVAP